MGSLATVVAAVVAVTSPAPVGSPTVAPPATSIPIAGAFVRDGAALDASAWSGLPHVAVRAADHAGVAHDYAGVGLADVLRAAGAPTGDAVRGPAARAYVLVEASDGYAALFSLGELAPVDARCAPLVVDATDGMPLPAADGPVRIVAPCDATHARWVHGVTKLTVVIARP